jgi:hypothetical protein
MDDWRKLAKDRRFAEAEPLMLADTEPIEGRYGENTVARAEFYEAWGDATRSPLEAIDRYNQADFYFGIFASWSTSGGEGTARMRDVNRVQNKVRNVRRELGSS